MDSSKISYFRARLFVFLESWAIQHKGTYSYFHHGQRRGEWHLNHGRRLFYAHRLWYQVVLWKKTSTGTTHANHGFLSRWRPPPIPSLALEHDMAWCPGSLRAAKRR